MITKIFEKKPIRPCVTGLFIKDKQKILLQRRPSDKTYAGWWEFPGGKIEATETPLQALVREMQEEVGVSLDSSTVTPLMQMEHDFKGASYRFCLEIYIICQWDTPPRPLEGQEIRWIDISQLQNYATLPGVQEAVKECLERSILKPLIE